MAEHDWPRCIHLAGVDGTGKSTQVKHLLARMEADGVEPKSVWLRFPRLFSVPFLVYARLRGLSHREVVEGHEHGYWDFENSWLMSYVFPWVLLLDSFLFALVKVYVPLAMGRTLLCDRFVVDTLADLMAGIKREKFDQTLPGRLYLALLPRGTRVVVLDLPTELARERSPELRGDRTHAQRRAVYAGLAERQGFPLVSTAAPVEVVAEQMVDVIKGSRALAERRTEEAAASSASH